jgi:acyl phosphate:glycerol-3-phosphate acyltransferase
MMTILLVLAGYVLGSIPSGYWLPKLFAGVDIRRVGSGNTGAANVWRTVGFKVGLAVALLDIGKGFAAALLGLWLDGELTALLAGMAATAGHYRPLFMGFRRGGKIVATTGGVAFALAPLAAFATLGVWIVAFLVSRYTSVASMTAATALPVLVFAFGGSWLVVGFAVAAAVAILILHRANIGRLVRGEENRFAFHRRRILVSSTPKSSR